jgi:succinate-semialdehyde dehydrogenase/glutarate-semialdehyde dehydrogenase
MQLSSAASDQQRKDGSPTADAARHTVGAEVVPGTGPHEHPRRSIMAIATVNPATGKTEKTFSELGAELLEEKLARAYARAREHRKTTFAQRAEWLNAAADLLDSEPDDVAAMMTTEMGKTLTAAKGEVAKCAKGMRFYAEHAESFLADEPV